MFAAAVNQGFGGRNGSSEDFGDFFVAQFAFAAEQDGSALFFGQFGESRVDLVENLSPLGGVGRGEFAPIFELTVGMRLVVGMRFIQGIGWVSGAAADFVQAQIAGDGEEEGAEFGRRLIPFRRPPHLDEDGLGEVFGLHFIGQRAVNKADDRLLPAFDQGGERRVRGLAAAFYAEQQFDIRIDGRRRRHGDGQLCETPRRQQGCAKVIANC